MFCYQCMQWAWEQGQRDAENPNGAAVVCMIIAAAIIGGMILALRLMGRRR